MSNVLVISDDPSAILTAEGALTTMQISPVRLTLEDFDPELLLAEAFDLIIFELFGENRSCITILKQLEKLASTSGIDRPPVIVLSEQGAGVVEQALRTANVNFFFVKPLAEADLVAAIRQSLLQPRIS